MTSNITKGFNRIVKNRYIVNTFWLGTEKILHLISILGIGVLLARYLGPVQLGILTYVQSYVALFTFFVGLGLNQIIVRDIVNKPTEANVIIGTSLALRTVAAIFIIILINIVSLLYHDKELFRLLIIIQSMVLFNQIFLVFENFFQAKVKSKLTVICRISCDLFLILFKSFLIVHQAELIYFVIVDVTALLLLSVGFVLVYQYSEKSIRKLRFSKSVAKRMLINSWPLMLSSGLIILYMRIDQIMIERFLGVRELGNYAVSVRVSEAWYFIPMVITASFFPAILNAREQNQKIYIERLNKLFFLVLWIAVFISVFISLFSKDIISILFGKEYDIAYGALRIQAFAGVFVAMGYVNGKWMVAENFTKLELLRSVLGVCVNVVLNLFLIPYYGISGAAVSTLIAVFIASNMSMLIFKETRNIFYLQNYSLVDFRSFKNIIVFITNKGM